MMSERLSQPIETLLSPKSQANHPAGEAKELPLKSLQVDTLIVGSGYGAAMAALALAGRIPGKIWVFERGREVVPGEFPETLGALPGEFSVTTEGGAKGVHHGLWDIRVGKGISAVLGRGLGGGSLINAGVALAPPEEILKRWPREKESSWETWRAGWLSSQGEVQRILGVNVHPRAESLSKYQALVRLTGEIADDCPVRPAPLTVRFSSGKNAVGVEQRECIDCGNCVSGCNTGAKGSLDMNAWPLARSRGTQIFTGATVRRIRTAEEGGYQVEVSLTHDPQVRFFVEAKRVIVAAGTYGSTEILERSTELSLSRARLGKRFSGNGDLLGYGEGLVETTLSVADEPSTQQAKKGAEVGPTIVGHAHVPPQPGRKGRRRHLPFLSQPPRPSRPGFLLEDGAVPYPVRRVLEEVIVTQNTIRTMTDGRLPVWHRPGGGGDPVSGSLHAVRHHPIHLVMGRDGGQGRLSLFGDHLLGTWPDPDEPSPAGSFFEEVGEALTDASRSLSGQARRRPDDEGPIRELEDLGQHLITVHPLGGCAMAERAEDGVVNPQGEVFNSESGTGTHAGLFVWDGSILPEAPGVNPFLTIATLSHYLALNLARREGQESIEAPIERVDARFGRRAEAIGGAPISDPTDERVHAKLRERMFLRLSDEGQRAKIKGVLGHAKLPAESLRLLEKSPALVVDITIDAPDLFEWLQTPAQPLLARFEIAAATEDFGDKVPTTALAPLGAFQGEVVLGHLDPCPPESLRGMFRRVSVIGTFLRLRWPEVWRGLTESLGDSVSGAPRKKGDVGLPSMLRSKVRAIWALSGVQANRRAMIYRFEDGGVRFFGKKRIEYSGQEPDPLKVLTELPFIMEGGKSRFEGLFLVDVIRFTGEPSALQVDRTPDSPHTALAMAAATAFVARGVLQAMFWSFRRPSYRRFGDKEAENTPRLLEPPTQFSYSVRDSKWISEYVAPLDLVLHGSMGHGAQADGLGKRRDTRRDVRLVRVRQTHLPKPRATILMIHGLAHGSRVFWTETVDAPHLSSLLAAGCDVWLLDHSLSTNLRRSPNVHVTMDDIAQEDIPWAVRHVFERTNLGRKQEDQEGIHVFAHCIGAGCFSMAVLSGYLQRKDQGGSMIASLVNHAVTPWMIASKDNRWRANALSLYKDQLAMPYFDPIPHNAPESAESLYDALAGSFSWGDCRKRHEGDERGDQFSRTVCNRMTLFYGQEWVHSNLDARTHEQIASLVGPGSLEILRQANFCVVRGRLTNRSGENAYMREENFLKYWDFSTTYLHGDKNCVFHVEASKRSAAELDAILSKRKTRPKVRAIVIPGYGHMDMLFGKEAHKDVIPAILSGFGLADAPRGEARPRRSSGVAIEVIPECGPIISHPRLEDGRLRLRVWAAANDLAIQSPDVLCLAEFPEQPLGLKTPRSFVEGEGAPSDAGDPSQGSSRFFLDELVVERTALPRGKPPSASGNFIATAGGPFAERHPPGLHWSDLPWIARIFEQSTDADELSFVVSSCLYPGLGSEQILSDSVFSKIRTHVEGSPDDRGIDHLLLLGDQIYADASGDLFDPISPYERFRKRYRRAFGGPLSTIGRQAHWVLSHVPAYFCVDDHEIGNDWTLAQDGAPTRSEEAALDAAYNFLIHDNEAAGRFWHSFESRGVPFFVFDTRTERRSDRSRTELESLLSQEQQVGFTDWLEVQKSKGKGPLFLCSGSVFAPITKALSEAPALFEREDSLLAFPAFFEWIHSQLSGLENPVVWLSGDLHTNLVSELTLHGPSNRPDVHLIQVVASGLFSPIPFINAPTRSFECQPESVEIERGGVRISAKHQLLTTDCQSSFVRIDLSGQSMRLRGFSNLPETPNNTHGTLDIELRSATSLDVNPR